MEDKRIEATWEWNEEKEDWICSNCGAHIPVVFTNGDFWISSKSKYCHECGARCKQKLDIKVTEY